MLIISLNHATKTNLIPLSYFDRFDIVVVVEARQGLDSAIAEKAKVIIEFDYLAELPSKLQGMVDSQCSVVCFTEQYMLAAGALRDSFGLTGLSAELAERISNKVLMKRLLDEQGIAASHFAINDADDGLNVPTAKSNQPHNQGRLFHVDCLVQNGDYLFEAVSQYNTVKSDFHSGTTLSSIVLPEQDATAKRLKGFSRQILEVLAFKTGPSHLAISIDDNDELSLVEFNASTGEFWIVPMLEKQYDFCLFSKLIDIELGLAVTPVDCVDKKYCFGGAYSTEAGVLYALNKPPIEADFTIDTPHQLGALLPDSTRENKAFALFYAEHSDYQTLCKDFAILDQFKPFELGSHHYQLFIDGQWRDGGLKQSVGIVNPANEQVIGLVAQAETQDIDDALVAAKKGLKLWTDVSMTQRAKIINDAAADLRQQVDALAYGLTVEQGKPLVEAKGEMIRAIETLEWTAEQADCGFTKNYVSNGFKREQLATPMGVIAAIIPWNYPAVLCARKLAPALIAGCSVVLKGAEQTPGVVVAMVEALHRAGLPNGVVNLLFGRPRQICEQLLNSGVIRKLSFTGSTAVGKQLAVQAAQHLIPCTLELGGQAPIIIDDGVDIDEVAQLLCQFKFRAAGQGCNVPNRIYVMRQSYDALVQKLCVIAETLVAGNGLEPKTTMGALTNAGRMAAMDKLINDALARGAKLQTGASQVTGTGYFWPPTILTDVPEQALIHQEEPFGPVLTVTAVDSIEQALSLANNSDYGLAGYGFSNNPEVIDQLKRQLDVGYVGINKLSGVPEDAPVCGIKQSGYGVEGGLAGIEAFTYGKLVTM